VKEREGSSRNTGREGRRRGTKAVYSSAGRIGETSKAQEGDPRG